MDPASTAQIDPFGELYQANHRRIRVLLARMVGPQDAEDVAQNVFAKASKALPKFRGEAEAATWLYRIAVNAASDWLRSRSAHEAKLTVTLPETAGEGGVEGMAAISRPPSPEEELARKDVSECLRGEIAKLPDAYRAVFMLNALGGLSDEEIAHTLGLSAANTRVRLHRARQEFRKIVAARCDFYSAELSCKPSSPDCCAPEAPDATSGRR
jgi:RNA polymerase sigma-70 factor, ECF subfamily